MDIYQKQFTIDFENPYILDNYCVKSQLVSKETLHVHIQDSGGKIYPLNKNIVSCELKTVLYETILLVKLNMKGTFNMFKWNTITSQYH